MLRYLLYQVEYRRWLFLALAVALIIHFIPVDTSLSPAGKSILAIVALTILLVIFEPIPLPLISFLIVVLEVLFGVARPAEVAQSFMSDSVIFILGSLMLAVAVVKQQLDKRILFFILRLTRDSVRLTVMLLVVIAGALASIMGEHSVAAIMLPVSLILVRIWQENQLRETNQHVVFLMSVAFGAAVAAIGTPSGGARNAIMLSYWEGVSGVRVSYLQWVFGMYPLVIIQLPILYFLLLRVYRPAAGGLTNAFSFLRREMQEQKQFSVEDWITVSIMLLTVALWMMFSGTLGLGPVALLGVLLCVVSGVLNWDDISHDVNWGVPILYASIISTGLWMDSTGAAAWVADHLSFLLAFEAVGGRLLLIATMTLLSMLVGAVVSSGPAIALLGPIFLRQAQLSGADPLVFGMILVAGASYANFTPVSSPACTIIYGSGMVPRSDYFALGLRVAVISFVIIVAFGTFYWPFVTAFF
ncbi:MAG: DASS family sodium-coupled anion symporter [Acidobacteria bacterium]|nr:MAG: DASS family sodium-coupled anion symporter [Acidobacteriota bacterium]